jgi:hypothetical protein
MLVSLARIELTIGWFAVFLERSLEHLPLRHSFGAFIFQDESKGADGLRRNDAHDESDVATSRTPSHQRDQRQRCILLLHLFFVTISHFCHILSAQAIRGPYLQAKQLLLIQRSIASKAGNRNKTKQGLAAKNIPTIIIYT